jgi:type II secretory pathway component PulJ
MAFTGMWTMKKGFSLALALLVALSLFFLVRERVSYVVNEPG